MKENNHPRPKNNAFPIVGVGASAGGLNAFKLLIEGIKSNIDMAFILVQHLDPKRESHLSEILQYSANVQVTEITDGIEIEPNRIYVLPSNSMLNIEGNLLKLLPYPKKRSSSNLPIDEFFKSLAKVHKQRAIGVVLSGTANDGTEGLRAIKKEGGITIAQDPETAEWQEMPTNVIKTGDVDYILSPQEIPLKIKSLWETLDTEDEESEEFTTEEKNLFVKILKNIENFKGTDFTYYKQTTIRRRILRRMGLTKSKDLAEYYKTLSKSKAEQRILYQDLLIPVTKFFRDPEIFEYLCAEIFPSLIESRVDNTLRVWVSACSTGEEAYSMAICLKEYLLDQEKNNKDSTIDVTKFTIQFYATDLSEKAIVKARKGFYSDEQLEHVSEKRLNKFFTRTKGGYQIDEEIRDLCVFAVHDFLNNPPFGKMDLISCRNVLIYFQPRLQKKALETFHYALRDKGYLLLGNSETARSSPDHFIPLDNHNKFFKRKSNPTKYPLPINIRNSHPEPLKSKTMTEKIGTTDFNEKTKNLLLDFYSPQGVVVNDDLEIVHFFGNTNKFLTQQSGKPSHNLIKMAKKGLEFELRNIVFKAKKENQQVDKKNIHVVLDQQETYINLSAKPFEDDNSDWFIVLFQTVEKDQLTTVSDINLNDSDSEKDLKIHQLEMELENLREDIRAITEDQ